MSKCKGDYKFTLTQKLTADIIIFPILDIDSIRIFKI